MFNSMFSTFIPQPSAASPKDTHGPVVKTGPTAGKNRSRNKDGRWRKKRSDTGKPRG